MTGTSSEARLALPTRTLSVFLFLLAVGAVTLLFVGRTIHRWSPEELLANSMAARSHFQTTYWLEHGYFNSGGLLVSTSATKPVFFYRSSTGGVYVSGFITEKIYSLFTGRYSWRLMALHNEIFLLIASTLVALLGFQLARRLGAHPLHALTLAICLQAVHFTFPDNQMNYWEMSARIPWLLFVCVFLLIEVRCLDGRTRTLSVAQALAAFALTYMEFIAGVTFIASYVVVSVLLTPDPRPWKRVLLIGILPMLLALGVYRGQLAWVHFQHPAIPMDGSELLFRTGLDGSAQYYADHADIYARRDVIQKAVFPKAGPWLFRWKWLFFAGSAALLGILALAMRGRVLTIVVVSLLSMLGSYLLDAAFFSQAVFIHPYLYDVMLFTPLVVALLVIAPTLLEGVTEHRGIAVAAVFFVAVWVSTVQLRHYAMLYPVPPAVEASK
jgi:hypothetical protein